MSETPFVPSSPQVLATCSNLMVWGEADICWDTGVAGLPSAKDNSAAGAMLRRATQRVYREYQRQLFDPTGWRYEDVPTVRLQWWMRRGEGWAWGCRAHYQCMFVCAYSAVSVHVCAEWAASVYQRVFVHCAACCTMLHMLL